MLKRNRVYNLFIFTAITIIYSCKSYNISDNEYRYLLADNSNKKYYLVELIRKKQQGGEFTGSPLVLVDNDIICDALGTYNRITISAKDIHNIHTLPSDVSVKLYGARGKNGFIQLNTIGWKKKLP